MKKFIFFSLCLAFTTCLRAETIVRFHVEQGVGGAHSNIDLKLYDSIAPATVNSFLSFVDAPHVFSGADSPTGSYENSFFHTITSDAFIEGGRFSYTPPDPFVCVESPETADNDDNDTCDFNNEESFPGGLQRVTTDDYYLESEFLRQNKRGTIAIEQVLPGEFSKSHWFINLLDNPTFDVFNVLFAGFVISPYTVFGEVINDTFVNVESLLEVDTFDRSDINSEFSNIPLINYTGPDIDETNLVTIVSSEKLLSINSSLPANELADSVFIIDDASTDNFVTISIQNLSSNIVTISQIADIDDLSLPFIFDQASDSCTGTALLEAESCDFNIVLNESSPQVIIDTFNVSIDISGQEPINYSHELYATFLDSDLDGVVDATESASPNNGDFNGDELPDKEQANVTTFSNGSGEYTSLVVEGDQKIRGFVLSEISDIQIIPVDARFINGSMNFSVNTVPPGGVIEVGVVLPENLSVQQLYTLEDIKGVATWVEYEATQILNNSIIGTPSGETISRNIMKFFLQDGGEGDADLEANGRIETGDIALSLSRSSPDSSAATGFNDYILILLSIFIFRLKATSSRYANSLY